MRVINKYSILFFFYWRIKRLTIIFILMSIIIGSRIVILLRFIILRVTLIWMC